MKFLRSNQWSEELVGILSYRITTFCKRSYFNNLHNFHMCDARFIASSSNWLCCNCLTTDFSWQFLKIPSHKCNKLSILIRYDKLHYTSIGSRKCHKTLHTFFNFRQLYNYFKMCSLTLQIVTCFRYILKVHALCIFKMKARIWKIVFWKKKWNDSGSPKTKNTAVVPKTQITNLWFF